MQPLCACACPSPTSRRGAGDRYDMYLCHMRRSAWVLLCVTGVRRRLGARRYLAFAPVVTEAALSPTTDECASLFSLEMCRG